MLAARKASFELSRASRRSACAVEISLYSTTAYLSPLRATTPTLSCGSVLRTTLAPQSACWEMQYPRKTGSATRTRQLSTQYACTLWMLCDFRCERIEDAVTLLALCVSGVRRAA